MHFKEMQSVVQSQWLLSKIFQFAAIYDSLFVNNVKLVMSSYFACCNPLSCEFVCFFNQNQIQHNIAKFVGSHQCNIVPVVIIISSRNIFGIT